MSKALTTPSSAASTKISVTVILWRQRECGQHERQEHGRDLSSDNDVLAVAAVGDDPADGGEQEYGNLAGKANRAQLKPGSGEAINKPRLRDGLHPGADQRNQLSAEEELEVAMAQGASGILPARGAALASWGGHGRVWPGRVLKRSFRFSHVEFFG